MKTCKPCDSTCITCMGIENNECLTCDTPNLFVLNPANKCVCESGYTKVGGQCELCYVDCFSCFGVLES